MKLNLESITKNPSAWTDANIELPVFDVAAMRARTEAEPEWVHFGPGNIFRSFIASVSQDLLNEGLMKTGIIACETLDYEIVDKVYAAHDNLSLAVLLDRNGGAVRKVLASVAKCLKADPSDGGSAAALKDAFRAPSLKIVSFTITEKGYRLRDSNGALLPVVEEDIAKGPASCRHAMSVAAAMMLERFNAGRLPVALVPMDNRTSNGDILRDAVVEIAKGWTEKGLAPAGFVGYLEDGSVVSFPCSMIDKITPRPHDTVRKMLAQVEDIEPVATAAGARIAPFVNAERSQYLVVEDRFPNGRPPLESAPGIYMTDRDTVEKAEKMKVMTCLNPLQTALAVFGYLFGYPLACSAMMDEDIMPLIDRLGYIEGLPVVTDPGIISPDEFINEVVGARLPNPYVPDDPRRLATDTSHKVGIRFGETVKSYIATGRDLGSFTAIPLVIAGWLRYLLGVSDTGETIELAPDPMNGTLRERLKGIVWNDPSSYHGELRPILANAEIFRLDLTATPLAAKIEDYFTKMLSGPGSVRALLRSAL